ncbi:hypothetical protein YC2023_121764 [Brassica napus]
MEVDPPIPLNFGAEEKSCKRPSKMNSKGGSLMLLLYFTSLGYRHTATSTTLFLYFKFFFFYFGYLRSNFQWEQSNMTKIIKGTLTGICNLSHPHRKKEYKPQRLLV